MYRDNFLLKQLGARIAYLRKERHMSQLALSISAGIAKTYLCDLEKGKRNPTISLLNQISISLGMNLEELFLGIASF